ncbi:MAG TPA: ATP-binding protein [Armatimonadota bacterium]|nr:ATP-binding protein [Armatimonadota bacterium]
MMDLGVLLASPESEAAEYKETWDDDCLKALAGLANRRGGILLVGVSDDRKRIPGWYGDGKAQERVSNQIVSTLHIHPLSLAVQDHSGKPVLVVEMPQAASPVAVRGRYYRRVGNSTREVTTEELPRFLLERTGQFWDGLPCEAGVDALSEKALVDFRAEAQLRLPALSPADAPERVLDNLELHTADGRLRRAALLLFGKPREPQRVALTAQVHMGRFKDAVTVLDDKMFGGNLFGQLDAVMHQFRQYFQVRHEFHKQMGEMTGLEAMRRIEIWDYPLDALREAVANALLHRDYTSSGQTMIQVFDDQVIISNPGGLPDNLKVEDLLRPHRSHPRNPLMAQAFYFASVVERWGSGTTRMAELCRE